VHTRERKGGERGGGGGEREVVGVQYDNVMKRKKKGVKILAVSKHARTSKQIINKSNEQMMNDYT
jgi:hypothetical protein